MGEYYARTASKYIQWHAQGDCDDGSHNFAVARLLSLAKSKGYKRILDVCCGTGRATKACLEQGLDAHGVDFSQELINEGIRQWGLPTGAFTCADATKLPFPDNHFDVSCVLSALHHSALPERIIDEMIRVSRHAIVVSDEGNHIPGGIKAALKKLGLFDFVYRAIFRRPPRTNRRLVFSEGDGPTFVFSIEEVLPAIRARFAEVKTFQFYRVGRFQVMSSYLPHLVARQVVAIADLKKHA
jgi:ubiquinone/menaquinone biosynthesis C-methylase UbiE